LYRLDAIGGLADHVDPVGSQDDPEPGAHQALIIGDHHPHRGRPWRRPRGHPSVDYSPP